MAITNLRPEPSTMTLFYDGECLLCRRSVRWVNEQNPFVPIHTQPLSAPEAIARFGHLPDYGQDMVVADDLGRIWVGPPEAYLVVMWAIPGLRLASYVLSISFLKPLAGRFFQLVSGNRHVIGMFLRHGCEHCQGGSEPPLSEVGHSRI